MVDELVPDRSRAVELTKCLLVDLIWKTANIEVDGIMFSDTQEIFIKSSSKNMHMLCKHMVTA